MQIRQLHGQQQQDADLVQPRGFKRRQRVGTLRIGAHVTAALKENRGEQGNNAPKRNPFDTENCES